MIRKTVLFACAAALAAPVLASAAWAAAPLPPMPPAPPPASMAPPAPPVPPVPPMAMMSWGHGDREVVSRNIDGRRLTVVTERDGGSDAREVLTYKDPDGRTVHVYSDKPVTRAEADKFRADAKVEGERARAEELRAREAGARAREEGARARIEGERARAEGERARAEAMVARERAVGEGRDVATLGRREVRVFQHDGAGPDVWIDGKPIGAMASMRFERPDVSGLHEEVRALREELKALRTDLDRERARR